MAQKPIQMELIKQIHQLHLQNVSIREIVRRTNVSRNSVRKYLKQIENNSAVPSTELDTATVYVNNQELKNQQERLSQLHTYINLNTSELDRAGVTRRLLWEEYLAAHEDGYGYSQFCYHLAGHLKQKDVSMHLEYKAGDMIMIDFAGKKLSYFNKDTGEVIYCETFVGVLPASGLIFCTAVASQQTADLVAGINAMLRYFGGSPATILGDNFKAAVIKPCRYEPQFTDVCYQLSEHYTTTFSATRPYKPKDKAMVEKAVSIIYTHIYGPLRNQPFDSIESLNQAIKEKLEVLNHKEYKNMGISRVALFEKIEKGLLIPLPTEPFTLKRVAMLTVQRTYHIQLTETGRYFSVPYRYAGKKVKVFYNEQTVEIYNDGSRIALHVLKGHKKVYNTLIEHMPVNHRSMNEIKGMSREVLLEQAGSVGVSVAEVAQLILSSNSYMEQNFKSCLGLIRLAKKYDPKRLELACKRALRGSKVSYTMIRNILERGLDKQENLINEEASSIPVHDNIRGSNHYQ